MVEQTQHGGVNVPPRRIFIVEDHAMMAQALALSLSAKGFVCEIAVLGEVDAIRGQAAAFGPHLVLLDMNLGSADGLELVAPLIGTGARVLVVSGSSREPRLAAALALGAVGLVRKTQPFEELIAAAVDTLDGKPLLSTEQHDMLAEVGRERLATERDLAARMARLTAREREVLLALTDGHTAQDIAQEMYVSVATVRSHVRSILIKLGVSNQLAAVALARELDDPS